MYATNIQEIEIPYLHDAALTLSYRTDAKHNPVYKFRSLYMDISGECAISYYGHLTEEQIKEVMINFCYPGEDKCYDEIYPKLGDNYIYNDEHSCYPTDKPHTMIFTPDGLDYRTLRL